MIREPFEAGGNVTDGDLSFSSLGLDFLGGRFDERFDEVVDLGILAQFAERFLGEIDPGLAAGETADIEADDEALFVGGGDFSAQAVAVGEAKLSSIGRRAQEAQEEKAQANRNETVCHGGFNTKPCRFRKAQIPRGRLVIP